MTGIREYKQKLQEKDEEIALLDKKIESLHAKLKTALLEVDYWRGKAEGHQSHIDDLKEEVDLHQSKHESLKEILGLLERRCNHKKKEFFTKSEEFQCDNCHAMQPKGALMFGCRECNFDYCQNCGGPQDRRVFHFDRHSKIPWGVAVDLEENPIHEWYVTRIDNGLQFDKKGVQVGWRIHKVNRYGMKEQHKEKLVDILQNGKKCIIEFDVTYSPHATRDEGAEIRQMPDLHLQVGRVHFAGTWYPAAIASSQSATILDSPDAFDDNLVGRVINKLKPSDVNYAHSTRAPVETDTESQVSNRSRIFPRFFGGSVSKRSGWSAPNSSVGDGEDYNGSLPDHLDSGGGPFQDTESKKIIVQMNGDDAKFNSSYEDSMISTANSISVEERFQRSDTLLAASEILNRQSPYPVPSARNRAFQID